MSLSCCGLVVFVHSSPSILATASCRKLASLPELASQDAERPQQPSCPSRTFFFVFLIFPTRGTNGTVPAGTDACVFWLFPDRPRDQLSLILITPLLSCILSSRILYNHLHAQPQRPHLRSSQPHAHYPTPRSFFLLVLTTRASVLGVTSATSAILLDASVDITISRALCSQYIVPSTQHPSPITQHPHIDSAFPSSPHRPAPCSGSASLNPPRPRAQTLRVPSR